MNNSNPPKLFHLIGRTRGPRGMSVHGLRVEAVGMDDPGRVLASSLTNRQGDFLIEIVISSDATSDLALIHVRDHKGNLIHTDRRKIRISPRRRRISLRLKKEALVTHNSRQVSWPEMSGRLIADEVLDEVRAALDILAINEEERRQFAAVLDAAAPRILGFQHLLDDAVLAIQGDIGALDRVAAALQVSERDEPNIEYLKTHFQALKARIEALELTSADIEPPSSRILEPERLVLLGAAAALAGMRENEGTEQYLYMVDQTFSKLRTYASLVATVLEGLYGQLPEFDHARTLMMVLGGRDPGLHPDGDDFSDLEPEKPREIKDITLNDPKTFQPVWDEAVILGLCAFLQANQVLPTYHVDSMVPANACAGDVVTILGHGFGTKPGYVAFNAPGGHSAGSPTDVQKWTDTEIQVIVPVNATCGHISLVVFNNTVTVCGPVLDLNPAGTGAVFFDGGLPSIRTFTVNGQDSDDFCVAPGEKVTISWDSCGDAAKVVLQDAAGKQLTSGGPQLTGTITYQTPTIGSTQHLKALIQVGGSCTGDTVTQQIEFWLHRKPALSIHGIEVTQAIQYYRADEHLDDPNDRGPDNSLRLMAGKSALVRVYLRSGQDLSWDAGLLTNVSGKLRVDRLVGGKPQKIAVLDRFFPSTTIAESGLLTSYDVERGSLVHTLNFIIPGKLMTGRLRLTAVATSADAICGGGVASRKVEVDVPLRKRLRLRAVRYDYRQLGGPLLAGHPANWIGRFIADVAPAYAMFPVAEPVFLDDITFLLTPQTIVVPLDDAVEDSGGCSANWNSVVNHITYLAFLDGPKLNTVYVAYLPPAGTPPNGIPINQRGCGDGGIAAAPAGDTMSLAHEIGHAIGLPHSPANVDYDPLSLAPLYPVYEPYDKIIKGPVKSLLGLVLEYQLQNASIGEYGVDLSNWPYPVFSPGPPAYSSDIMSYRPNRWISIWNHRKLSEQPAPYVYTTSEPLGSGPKEPQPLIVLFGQLHSSNDVEVADVIRLTTRQAHGELTDLVAELLDDEENVLSSGNVFAHLHLGVGTDELVEVSPQPPFHFIATIPEKGQGAVLRIRRGREEIWRREHPSTPVHLSDLSVDIIDSQLTIGWTAQAAEGYTVKAWLSCSEPEGADRTALVAAIEGNSMIFDLEDLPGGARVFEVAVTDGFFTDRITSEVIDIPQSPRTAAILSPRDGTEVEAGTSLRLWGFSPDEEDADFRWTIDGEEVANEPDNWIMTPSRPGPHEIRLEVGDATANVTITVRQPDELNDS